MTILGDLTRALRKLLKFGLNPYEYLKDHDEIRYFDVVTVDLTDAHNDKDYKMYGEAIYVDSLDGNVTIAFNEVDNKLNLYVGRKCYQDFWRFFITNTAQPGKTLNLIIYKEGAFDVFDTDYWLNILKDKQDYVIAELTDLVEIQAMYKPSDDLLLSNNAQKQFNSDDYTKLKEILIGRTGAYKIKHDSYNGSTDGQNCITAIFVNGDLKGTENTNSTESWRTYTDNSISLERGDLLQLYGRRTGELAGAKYVMNLRVYGVVTDEIGVNTLV